MTQFALAARSQIHNVLLCTLATLTLAACGSESGSSSAAAASTDADSVASLVSPNVGVIDRTPEVTTAPGILGTAAASSGTSTGTGTQNVAANSGTTPSSGTTSSTTATSGTTTTPASGTTTSGTTVASSTPPVKAPVKTGAATLDWMPPTQNSDGSVLTNLAGYTVYYGTSPDNLTQSIKVTNPGLTAYTVTDLSSGTWYFTVTSYSSAGVESTRTRTVSTTI